MNCPIMCKHYTKSDFIPKLTFVFLSPFVHLAVYGKMTNLLIAFFNIY